ncbi:inorganic triphosphatase [Mannheimia glucosida]|uniref:CYTH domain-containing protein n=1 Tax=Mannheimia glucosida TaxID=85401 RepID=UPI003917BFEB
MENQKQAEIELKIMLEPQNVALVENYLNQTMPFPVLAHQTELLGNTYYDTPAQFFATQKMGLRVRSVNQQYEITLKTQGEIVGGLHIRPEYNLALPNSQPDFQTLVEKYQLPFENSEQIAESLQATFSTDFTRKTWLLRVGQSELEVALDLGTIKNHFGEEPICELEFEIKQGELSDLFTLVDAIPKANGMWLSNLSKAQRGYLLGQAVKFEQKIATAVVGENSEKLAQLLADFIRIGNEKSEVLARFNQCTQQQFSNWQQARAFVKSQAYLEDNLKALKQQF